MESLKQGDFVTGYGSGYWQLLDIKPKIAIDDYISENISWKKGDLIGQWAILKKCFTAKMRPRIEFSYEDFTWLKPVSSDILTEIETYFAEHPEYKQKFDNAQMKPLPMVTNCWINLSEKEEEELKNLLDRLPYQFTMDEFWEKAKKFKNGISKPPTSHLINFMAYPWDVDKKANLLYYGIELNKL